LARVSVLIGETIISFTGRMEKLMESQKKPADLSAHVPIPP
jgi:hypothetical protein